jgi:acetyl esterase/lipase
VKVRVALVAGILIAVASVLAWRAGGARPQYVPRVAALRGAPFYVFAPSKTPPRATIVFLGNDVGFWKPHEELGAYLAGEGFGVVGVDIRPLLHSVSDLQPPARDSAFARQLGRIILESMDEFGATAKPLVLMGHSLGAEIAIWSAAHVHVAQLAGVAAMSPGSRGHLRVSFSDLLETAEPSEPGSFAVADEAKAMPPNLRLVVLRGNGDKYRYADSAIVAAAPSRVTLTKIPFAGHSLKRIIVAKYYVRNAVESIVK